MRVIRLTLTALAASLSLSIANADHGENMDVIVVKAERPDIFAMQEIIAVEKVVPSIDIPRPSIEAPSLDPSTIKLTPARIDVALQEETESKS